MLIKRAPWFSWQSWAVESNVWNIWYKSIPVFKLFKDILWYIFWLPARWASGFSGDHQQDHQCLWLLLCYSFILSFIACILLGIKLLLLLYEASSTVNVTCSYSSQSSVSQYLHYNDALLYSIFMESLVIILLCLYAIWRFHVLSQIVTSYCMSLAAGGLSGTKSASQSP